MSSDKTKTSYIRRFVQSDESSSGETAYVHEMVFAQAEALRMRVVERDRP